MNESLEKMQHSAHDADQPRALSAKKAAPKVASPSDFRAMYERWFDDVSRWIRRLGGPEADCEDLVQDVFIVVHRRLPDFDGENPAGWLFQIARRRVRNFRRLRWMKHILLRRVPLLESLGTSGDTPAETVETNEKQALLARLLIKLNASEREALMLFELDSYSGTDIARMQGVPLNTVWARIRSARKKLNTQLIKYEGQKRGRGLQ